MKQSYITLSGSAQEEIIIHKSRFIGYAAPFDREAGALSFLQRIKETHKTATHHCFAYIIGENNGIMRYSDDGEPGGTAGLPIMDVLRQKQIVNCCVVVVRYFGGVLLGTGGLVRAYTQAAQACVESAGLARMELTTTEYCELPYPVWDKFRYAVDRLPVKIGEIEYGTAVNFMLYYKSADKDTVFPCLMEASDRKLETVSPQEMFFPWEIEPSE